MLDHLTTYFYTPPSLVKQDTLKLKDEEAKHATVVLRNKKGKTIYVVDGVGGLYKCKIIGIEHNSVKCEVLETPATFSELPFNITLAVGMVRQKNMELILDQATQLGISQFVPLLVDFNVFEFKSGDHQSNILGRLEKIAIKAMKQSLRTRFPVIHPAITIDEFFKEHSFDLKVYADLDGFPNLKSHTFEANQDLFLAVGPEGGFSSREIVLLREWGCIPLMLGNRRLRTETAALALLTKILFWLKEI